MGFRVIAKSYDLFTFPSGSGHDHKKWRRNPREVKRVAQSRDQRQPLMEKERSDEVIQILSQWARIDRQSARPTTTTRHESSSLDGSIPRKRAALGHRPPRAP